MPKHTPAVLALLVAAAACAPAAARQPPRARAAAARKGALVILEGTRETDGLRGPVRRVETEVARVEVRQGRAVELPAAPLERTLYDERGRRVENETYPVAGPRAGRESHRYDERGNVIETVARDAAGATLSRTVYEYEFDEHGNWTRMIARVAVSNGGRAEYEPFEITRRSITYYAVEDPQAAAHGAARNGTTQNGATEGGATEGGGAARAAAAPVAAGESAAASSPPAAASSPPAGARRSLTIKAPSGGEVFDAGVLNGRATWLPQPAYPVSRRRLDTPYRVEVEVALDITGRVVGARARNGPAPLRDSAERAARLAAFLPFYVAGRPVRATGVINYHFDYLP